MRVLVLLLLIARVAQATPASDLERRKARLKSRMTAEILGEGEFAGRNNTPPLAIVGHGLVQTVQADFHSVPARYQIAAERLHHGRLSASLLLPVAGHLGAQAADQLRRTARYHLAIVRSDGARTELPDVVARDFVTELVSELPLGGGRNRIEFWPDGSGGVFSYLSGRIIEIDVKPRIK